jgi:hypothetical protein
LHVDLDVGNLGLDYIEDASGNNWASPGSTMIGQDLVIGDRVNWGAYAGNPKVIAKFK